MYCAACAAGVTAVVNPQHTINVAMPAQIARHLRGACTIVRIRARFLYPCATPSFFLCRLSLDALLSEPTNVTLYDLSSDTLGTLAGSVNEIEHVQRKKSSELQHTLGMKSNVYPSVARTQQ